MPSRASMALTVLAALLVAGACSSDGDDGSGLSSAESDAAVVSTTDGPASTTGPSTAPTIESFALPEGSRPHDVWAASDGMVWYTGQNRGVLGVLDPASGDLREIALGTGSRPHGVIEGPDGAAWITDGGLNAIVRVDTSTDEVESYPLPADRPDANLNTAVFDAGGVLWFTGQAGVYGRLERSVDAVEVFDAPDGAGPYGITATADAVYYASLAGSYVGQVDPVSGSATVLQPPTVGQGTRRVWADSTGRVWSSQWTAGQVAVYDPADGSWQEWPLPGPSPQAYSIYVDDRDVVWLSDFGANTIVAFDPTTEAFTSLPLPSNPGEVRQIHGRPGEVWAPESAADQLVVMRTGQRPGHVAAWQEQTPR